MSLAMILSNCHNERLAYESFIKFPLAENSEELVALGKNVGLVGLTLTYASRSGNIGYYGMGKIPIRKN